MSKYPDIEELYKQWDEMRKPFLRTINVLDKGYITLLDFMGYDRRIAMTARNSYQKGTKKVNEDNGLVDYLIRHRHSSPVEFVEFTFEIKMPIFVHNQFVRHRTASQNVYSGRFSIFEDEFYVPESFRLQKQLATNKQGSDKELVSDVEKWLKIMEEEQNINYNNYENYLSIDMAKELARINLPLSLYTKLWWKCDLHNIFHLLKLRLDSHAQYEIREYAKAMYELIKPVVPVACASFEEHILNSVTLSANEWKQIKKYLPSKEDIKSELKQNNWSNRRIQESIEKLYKEGD